MDDKEAVGALRAFIEEKGYSPTVREMCQIFNVKGLQSVHTTLQHLRRQGLVDWEDGKARTLRITAHLEA